MSQLRRAAVLAGFENCRMDGGSLGDGFFRLSQLVEQGPRVQRDLSEGGRRRSTEAMVDSQAALREAMEADLAFSDVADYESLSFGDMVKAKSFRLVEPLL